MPNPKNKIYNWDEFRTVGHSVLFPMRTKNTQKTVIQSFYNWRDRDPTRSHMVIQTKTTNLGVRVTRTH